MSTFPLPPPPSWLWGTSRGGHPSLSPFFAVFTNFLTHHSITIEGYCPRAQDNDDDYEKESLPSPRIGRGAGGEGAPIR